MILHPALTLQYVEGELPSSFCSRVANRLGLSARQFCSDAALDFQGIVDGNIATLTKFAEVCRVDRAALANAAIVKDTSQVYSFCSETFSRETLSRRRVRACPSCLQDDLIEGMLVPAFRSVWQIRALQTCPRHQCAIVEIAEFETTARLHDYAAIGEFGSDTIGDWRARSAPRRPSELERYITRRLSGKALNWWLDKMALYLVVEACQRFGAVKLFGPLHAELNDEDLYLAGQAGFDLLRHDGAGLTALVRKIVSDAPRRDDMQLRRIFGRLHSWLCRPSGTAELNPFRQIIHDEIVSSLPFASGDRVFGLEVAERRVHSVHSAAKQFGMHPISLRKQLLAAKILPPGTEDLSDNRAVFDSQEHSLFLSDLADSMNLPAAAAYLGLPRPLDRLILQCTPRLVHPVVEAGTERLNMTFSRRALDEFRNRLLRDAVPPPKERTIYEIRSAAKRLNCSAIELFRLILGGSLQPYIRAEDAGIASILLDIEEARPLVQNIESPGFTIKEAAERLRTTDRVIAALIGVGALDVVQAKHPILRNLRDFIVPEAIEAFEATYVSLFTVARETKIHHVKLKAKLEKLEVEPSFDVKQVPARFYARTLTFQALGFTTA